MFLLSVKIKGLDIYWKLIMLHGAVWIKLWVRIFENISRFSQRLACWRLEQLTIETKLIPSNFATFWPSHKISYLNSVIYAAIESHRLRSQNDRNSPIWQPQLSLKTLTTYPTLFYSFLSHRRLTWQVCMHSIFYLLSYVNYKTTSISRLSPSLLRENSIWRSTFEVVVDFVCYIISKNHSICFSYSHPKKSAFNYRKHLLNMTYANSCRKTFLFLKTIYLRLVDDFIILTPSQKKKQNLIFFDI